MNDVNKSIECFESPAKHIKCVHKCENGMEFLTYSADLVAAFEDAISALQRHLPKKPIEPQEDYGTFQCPNCKGLIYTEDEFKTHKFCLMCGQAIDWSEE